MVAAGTRTRRFQAAKGRPGTVVSGVHFPARFILLDEPFSQIAPLHVATLQTLIRQEKASKGILLTDHMYRHVTGIADRLYVMADGQAYPCENDEDLVRRGYLNHL